MPPTPRPRAARGRVRAGDALARLIFLGVLKKPPNPSPMTIPAPGG
jgi:hypothetical protein